MSRLKSEYFILNVRLKRMFLLGLLMCFALTGAAAQQYRFDSWTTEEGLPQASVNSILQTRDGYLWLTTFGGLVRYDGLRFQVFNTGNTKGLKTGRFTHLLEDAAGVLWIMTEGQGLTAYRNGTFTTYTVENGLLDNLILRFNIDQNGNLLVESEHGAVQWSGEKFVPYIPASGEPTKNIIKRTADFVWYQEDNRLRKFEHGQITFDEEVDGLIFRVFEDSGGRVWCAKQNDELMVIEDGKIQTYSSNNGYPAFGFGIFEDRQKNLWFSSNNALWQFRNGKFTRFTTENGLIDNHTRYVYQDGEGTLWVGTSGGLNHLTERTITAYSQADGLAADNVYSIFQDRAKRIWIGSWTGLTVYENGTFRNVGASFGVDNVNVTALAEDRAGNFWIGSWNGEVRKIKDGQMTTFESEKLTGAPIRVIFEDATGNLWFGTSYGLIKYLDEQVINYGAAEGLVGKDILTIYEDRAKRLWIGTEAGLNKYENGVFTHYEEKDGIVSSSVRTVYEDQEGTFWIGTYDSGLYRFKDERFTRYTTLNGLFDNGVFQIIEDTKGDFWISCNRGIYRVRKADLNDFADGRIEEITSVPYNKRDGMLNSECNGGIQPAGLKTADGRIWFPTQKGVTVIDPGAIPFNSIPPPVVIQSVIIDTKLAEMNAPINLASGAANLEIQYSGLSFTNPELVKFKYKLEGLDDDWTEVGTRRTAYFSHLPPGNYKFKVLAANRDNVWNEQGAEITINVLPAFWQTWWFWILVSAAVVAAAWIVYSRRVTALRRTATLRETFARQLIASQEDERKRIAVELHDSLGQSLVLIKNWAMLEIKSKASGKPSNQNALQEITEMASESINEVREIAYNLGPFQLEKLGLKKSIEEMIAKAATPSGIDFTLKIDDVDDYLTKPSQVNIFRIIQEGVNNIIKHSAAKTAEISIKLAPAQIHLIIRDDGQGFAPKTSDGQSGSNGFGLLGMSQRAHLLKAEYHIESEPDKGTTIFINLPYELSPEKF